jgi:fucose permease
LSSNYLSILVGRLSGAALTRRPGRTVPLLHAWLTITAAGFVLFWLADEPVLAVVGLFVCGAGIANLYPLSVALTLGAAGGHEDRANARTQLLGGLITTATPLPLGSLADRHGLATAFARAGADRHLPPSPARRTRSTPHCRIGERARQAPSGPATRQERTFLIDRL